MKELSAITKKWNELIDEQSVELGEQLSEMEISALAACIPDCYQSFSEIYFKLFGELLKAAPSDIESVHDSIVDIYWQLDHIKNHITDAEKGFTVLMNLLAKKSEMK